MNQDTYIIEGGHTGKQRLRLIADVLHPHTARLFDQVGLRPGMHVLDVGCGGGNVTYELARRVGPSGHVIGLDRDAAMLELARADAIAAGLHNVAFRCADVRRLNERSHYDVVYARFLLTHLAAPERALAAMVEAVKPGGVVVVEDINISGSFCYPPCRAFDHSRDLYIHTVRHNGGDPNIGPRLPNMLIEAGLRDVGVQVAQPVYRQGDGKRIPQITLERIANAVLAANIASAATVATTVAELAAFAARQDTIISLPRIFQVWGKRDAQARC